MDWQQLLVYLIGAGAVLYLVRRYLAGRKAGACGDCSGGCGPKRPTPARTPELVQIEGFRSKPDGNS